MAMHAGKLMPLATLWFAVAIPVPAQTVTLFHATGPLPSYEVATIKKADGNGPGPMFMDHGQIAQAMKTYILRAYGASFISQSQIVGAPAWVSKDFYVIQGKPPEELRLAMQKMTPQEAGSQTLMLQQSLLADRFHFKMHYETREMPVYELTVAKGGLKINDVPAPPPFTPGAPPPPAPPPGTMRPGMMMVGANAVKARAIQMRGLISALRSAADIDGKPIVDKTGFAGYFDVTDLRWAGLVGAAGADTDAPSLFTALEEKLGLKLTATKGMVEVIVIDSIERPSEN